MNVIKFNNTEFVVESYNKTTSFFNDKMNSNASCTIVVDDIADLNALAQDEIDTIQITHDGTMIYNLQNADGHINTMVEYLSNDRMRANVNLVFGDTTITPVVIDEGPI